MMLEAEAGSAGGARVIEGRVGAVRVGLVGHCTPDSFAMKSAIGGVFDPVEVVRINDLAMLDAELGTLDVVLVNRVLDGSFGELSGHELIVRCVSSGGRARAMLISNYEESLLEAERLGAMPGFGKREMRSERAAVRLRAAVEAARAV